MDSPISVNKEMIGEEKPNDTTDQNQPVFFYPQVRHLWEDPDWYHRYTIDEVETIEREMARQMVETGEVDNPEKFTSLIEQKSTSIKYCSTRLQEFIWDLDLSYLNNLVVIKDKKDKSPIVRKVHRMMQKKNIIDRNASKKEKKMCLHYLANLPFFIDASMKTGNISKMANFF